MSHQSKSKSRLLWYVVGGVAVFAAVWAATAPSDKPVVTKKPVSKLPASTVVSDLKPEDYTVKFVKVQDSPKDVFKPLIYRKTAGGAASLMVNAIPPDFAGGETDWAYTGTGVIDGAAQASFENTKSGEAAFVHRGEHWKKAVVDQVTEDYCVVTGPSGTKKLQLPVDVVPTTVAQAPAASSAVAPINPTITGPIGMGTPDPTQTDASATTIVMPPGGGGGGRRGGGRRGGGGRGGGGGGGNPQGGNGALAPPTAAAPPAAATTGGG